MDSENESFASFIEVPKRSNSSTTYPKSLSSFIVPIDIDESCTDENTDSYNSVSDTTLKRSISYLTASSTQDYESNKLKFDIAISVIDEILLSFATFSKKSSVFYFNATNNDNSSEKHIKQQPVILFSAKKQDKLSKKDKNNIRKSKKYKHLMKIGNDSFKCKKSGIVITKLQNYYRKAKANDSSSNQIQKGLCSNSVSKLVSRSAVLKTVSAKLNLLDEDRMLYFHKDIDEDHDLETFVSFPSTTEASVPLSHLSQKTLSYMSSFTSQNNEDTDKKGRNSVVNLELESFIPFKTEIINVSVAKVCNTFEDAKNETLLKQESHIPNKEVVNPNSSKTESAAQKELTKSQSFIITIDTSPYDSSRLTSITNSNYFESDVIDLSEDTLVGPKSVSIVNYPSSNTFVVPKEEYTQFSSTNTLTFDTASTECYLSSNASSYNKYNLQDSSNRCASPDTVIDMVTSSIITPNSTITKFSCNKNREACNLHKQSPVSNQLVYDIESEFIDSQTNVSLNVLKKSFEKSDSSHFQKCVDIPDESFIKETVKHKDFKYKRSLSESFNNTNTLNISEIIDKLSQTLDSSLRRFEETLSETIDKRINKSYYAYDIHAQPIRKIDTANAKQGNENYIKENSFLKKSDEPDTNAESGSRKSDEALQCDLTQDQAIEKILLALSSDEDRLKSSSNAARPIRKLSDQAVIKDLSDILKSPLVKIPTMEPIVKTDSVAISTDIPQPIEEKRFVRIKLPRAGPIQCVRQNFLVIVTVPTFLTVMVLVYVSIAVMINP